MRRAREINEHREALRRKAVEERLRRRKAKSKSRTKAAKQKRAEIIERRQLKELKRQGGMRASGNLELSFQKADNYVCHVQSPPIKVAHVIESLGMGGGQTMMMELVNALDKYYPDQVKNIVCCPRPGHTKFEKSLYTSYGVSPAVMRDKDFSRYLARENIQVVLQHRLAVSKCLKNILPANVRYVLMNHTFHQLPRLSGFTKCDVYVSVCNYLHKQARWSKGIHPSRALVILNGVENDYVADIPDAELVGEFKTGRCHRLVSNKFRADSLKWMETKVHKHIPGHHHYIMGHNAEAKKICKKSSHSTYMGTVLKRINKMSIIKSLDLYFYETFGHEGASIAILEALACGVPVLCRNFGGNRELVIDGVNGHIVDSREDFLIRMKDLQDSEKLAALKASTIEDFNNRLHVKHTAAKYMQLFEALLK